MEEPRRDSISRVQAKHRRGPGEYEFYVRRVVPREPGKACVVSVYEIPPKRAAYPYHYHHVIEEVFYILSGKGVLRTPEGEREVGAGDLIYFPCGERGAHKLSNPSESEPLVYLDYDTSSELDVAVYPDSDKIGVWGCGVNKLFRTDESVDYYEGET